MRRYFVEIQGAIGWRTVGVFKFEGSAIKALDGLHGDGHTYRIITGLLFESTLAYNGEDE